MDGATDVRFLDAVVTHHTDGFRSGVARFNELLALHLRVPLLSLRDPLASITCPLLSFKVSELGAAEAGDLERLLAAPPWSWEIYLHEYAGLELEQRLVGGAQRVHCGNAQIRAAVDDLNSDVDELWAPGLIVDDRVFPSVDISVFSFGMAHKIRTDMFDRLHALLDASGRSYALFVSAANHETVALRDGEIVFAEMHELFPDTLYFLGNLSDVAIANWLRTATFFAAFFPQGVRANNTSVAAAMEHGSVVLTNLDDYSPREYVHNQNLLDIERCESLPTDPDTLSAIRERAMERNRAHNWNKLVERLRRDR